MAILILLVVFLLNEITLKTHKQYHNFEMLSRLNELELCELFSTELYSRSGCHSVKKSPHMSDSFRRESISKLPGGRALFVGL